MSYLRGPLTRRQIQNLSPPLPENDADAHSTDDAENAATTAAESTLPLADAAVADTKRAPAPKDATRPVVPPDVREVFFTTESGAPTYRPFVLGTAKVHFLDRRSDLEEQQEIGLLASLDDLGASIRWADADPIDIADDRLAAVLDDAPAANGEFLALPKTAARATSYGRWKKDLAEHLYRTSRVTLLHCPGLEVTAQPGETEREFRIRLAEAAHERRDDQMDKLRDHYGKKFTQLRERIRKAEQTLDREQIEAQSAQASGAISIGSTLLSAIFGRKVGSRVVSSARSASSAAKQMSDVHRARENLNKYRDDLAKLEHEFEAKTAAVVREIEAAESELEEMQLKPRRTDVDIRLLALAWVPVTW
jgi:hypothetical protein